MFAERDIPAGAMAIYAGTRGLSVQGRTPPEYLIDGAVFPTNAELMPSLSAEKCAGVNARQVANETSVINHATGPDANLLLVQLGCAHGVEQALIAPRPIPKGHQLLWDYADQAENVIGRNPSDLTPDGHL